MFIRLGYEIEFHVPAPVPMLLLLHTLPDRDADLRHPDRLRITPDVPVTQFLDTFGNRCSRIVAPAGTLRLCSDFMIEDPGVTLPLVAGAEQHPVQDLPTECLPFLLPSRYCESDRLGPRPGRLRLVLRERRVRLPLRQQD